MLYGYYRFLALFFFLFSASFKVAENTIFCYSLILNQ